MPISTRAEHLLSCGFRVYGVGREVGDGTIVTVARAASILSVPVAIVTSGGIKKARQFEFDRVGVSSVAYSLETMVKGLCVDNAGCEWLVVELCHGSKSVLDALDAHIPLYKG